MESGEDTWGVNWEDSFEEGAKQGRSIERQEALIEGFRLSIRQVGGSQMFKLKKRVLERDEFKCVNCGKPGDVIYFLLRDKAIPSWDQPDWYVVTLCKRCYENESRKRRNKDLVHPKKYYKQQ